MKLYCRPAMVVMQIMPALHMYRDACLRASSQAITEMLIFRVKHIGKVLHYLYKANS